MSSSSVNIARFAANRCVGTSYISFTSRNDSITGRSHHSCER